MALYYRTRIWLTLVVLLAVFLRLYEIDRESFWLDESFSYWWAQTSPIEMITVLANNVQTPLYYLTLHYWMKVFGDSDWAIRVLSVLFGILAIPVFFQIGKLLFNERFGLVAALFLAVSGFHIQYSQEARPYSLYFLLSSLSVFCTIRAHKSVRYAWFGYIISTVLLLYTHDTALLAVAATVVFYLLLSWPWTLSSTKSFLIANLVVLILYMPWIPVYISQVVLVQEIMWTSELTVQKALKTLQKLVMFPQKVSSHEWIQYGLLCVPFSILFLSVAALWATEKKKLIALAILFLIPVGVNLIFSITIRNIFIPRVFIPALLPLPFLWATPVLMEIGGKLSSYGKLATTAMALMLLISLGGSIHFLLHNSKEPWRQLVEIFQRDYKPGDAVVYLLPYNQKPFARYLPPSFSEFPVIAINEAKRGNAVLQAGQTTNARLWLVRRHGGTRSNDKVLIKKTLASLAANYKKLADWKLKNLEMVLYEPL